MLRTFKAVLKGNSIEWLDEGPELGSEPIPVHITVLEKDTGLNAATRGQKMAEVLEKLSASRTFPNIDPVSWQREIREDRFTLE